MRRTVRKIAEGALALPEQDRLARAAELIDSVEGAEDEAWSAHWSAELDRRVADAERSGNRGRPRSAQTSSSASPGGDRLPGLGVDSLGVVDLALGAIAASPDRYAVWPPNRYRRLALDHFPYIVFFHVPEHGPEVVAIAHAKRRPGYWLRRVGP